MTQTLQLNRSTDSSQIIHRWKLSIDRSINTWLTRFFSRAASSLMRQENLKKASPSSELFPPNFSRAWLKLSWFPACSAPQQWQQYSQPGRLKSDTAGEQSLGCTLSWAADGLQRLLHFLESRAILIQSLNPDRHTFFWHFTICPSLFPSDNSTVWADSVVSDMTPWWHHLNQTQNYANDYLRNIFSSIQRNFIDTKVSRTAKRFVPILEQHTIASIWALWSYDGWPHVCHVLISRYDRNRNKWTGLLRFWFGVAVASARRCGTCSSTANIHM